MRLERDVFGDDEGGGGTALLVAHGLLGAARNWGALARRMARSRRVVAVDMRNHGRSGWSDDVGYPAMAEDLARVVEEECGGRADVLGHSMGGKAAMALALTRPETISRLIVADIAPVAYTHSHTDTLEAMAELDLSVVTRRSDADAQLAAKVPDAGLRSFVLQNLALTPEGARWRPNIAALRAGHASLVGWPEELSDLPDGALYFGDALFLRGARSDYVDGAALPAVEALFPAARVETLADAGHWLHADQPGPFLAAVERFLDG
ncbi:alpha/beta fold hydrolase [Rubrimonas cliftonensis]|uniref:Pimeloyl-ACP methyl ester carboxylesterase n=1 Tax=Rubrimonas cliftonensis TaxID=89524 RepID=A0A1H3W1I0_9RHOB|nr:alpha/beta fold hydrolase [Rubrimonas cliftonensis]SDZ80913.1 Pimeloyl-ACP methyl ester carboxylesterase [Rubrimonas cliftonensis]